jgi:hypothetical protein
MISIEADELDSGPRRQVVNEEITRLRAMNRGGHSRLSSNADADASVCNDSEFCELLICQRVAPTKCVTQAHYQETVATRAHINFNVSTAISGNPTIFASVPAPNTSVRMLLLIATQPAGVS